MIFAQHQSDHLPAVCFFILLFLAFRIGIHYLDKSVINYSAGQKGWKRIKVKWSPFAPDALFETRERHYHVTYVDRDGKGKAKYCKTGLLTGVYWRD